LLTNSPVGAAGRKGPIGKQVISDGLAALVRLPSQELNKGESRSSLARAFFIRRRGEIRDRTYENQQHCASGLKFLVTAIILWNAWYLEHAIAVSRRTEGIPVQLLAHRSPLGWEHVNLIGDHVWGAAEQMTKPLMDSGRSVCSPNPPRSRHGCMVCPPTLQKRPFVSRANSAWRGRIAMDLATLQFGRWQPQQV
jgi:hypothetical protein